MRLVILFLVLFLTGVSAFGQTQRLYLKDGTFQLVREYQVVDDRVRYYSTERGEWEEIPKELVDFDRSKKENDERQEAIKADAKAQAEEDAAIRAAAKEVDNVPADAGAYWIHDDKFEPLKLAESKVVNNKGRNVLKVLSPIPLVTGKSTVELDGVASTMRIADTRPEFYFRLSEIQALAIIKLTPKKGFRLVENVTIMPVSNEMMEERQIIPTFKKSSGELLFKIWPEKALDPGEYALIQYQEGEVNMQVWDFAIVGQVPDLPSKKK
jgi:hypothetical protein